MKPLANSVIALYHQLDEILNLSKDEREKWLKKNQNNGINNNHHLEELLSCYEQLEDTNDFGTLPKIGNTNSNLNNQVSCWTSGQKVGAYTLIHKLGDGGMGEVWLADRTDGSFHRYTAIKFPYNDLYRRVFLERFHQERNILAALAHPNICRLYDAGLAEGGQPYLAMEYVQGENLLDYCNKRNIDIEGRLRLFNQVLHAVQFAHTCLIIHRDLKPSNIMVTDDGRPILLDFGIAKLIQSNDTNDLGLTEASGIPFSLYYASPEQVCGQTKITTSSDIYSLGIILYELLLGQRPYKLKRSSRGALEDAIINGEIVAPNQIKKKRDKRLLSSISKRKAAIGDDLESIILKALKKEPLYRYATVDAFAQDIERFLNGEAVCAQRDTLWYRIRKFTSRNRLVVLSISLIGVSLLVGLYLSLRSAHQAIEAKKQEEVQTQTAEAALYFLEDIFRSNSVSQPNPLKARQKTAKELLDEGTRKIDRTLGNSPDARLRVLKTLARMYDDIHISEQAVRLAYKRVILAKQMPVYNYRITVDSLIEYGDIATSADLQKESQAAFAEAATILNKFQDRNSVLRGKLYVELARNHWIFGISPKDSISLIQEGIKILRQYPFPEELATALMFNARMNIHAGNYQTARISTLEAIALSEKNASVISYNIPYLYMSLGEIGLNTLDLVNAEQYFRLSVQKAEAYYGKGSRVAILSKLSLAKFLSITSRIRESIFVLETAKREALSLSKTEEDFLEPGAMSPALALIAYGATLIDFGEVEPGIAELRSASKLWRNIDRSPELNSITYEQESAGLIEIGDYDNANILLQRALSLRQQLGENENLTSYNTNIRLRSKLAALTKKYDEAESILDRFQVGYFVKPSNTLLQLDSLLLRGELAIQKKNFQDATYIISQIKSRFSSDLIKKPLDRYRQRLLNIDGTTNYLMGEFTKACPILEDSVALSRSIFHQTSPISIDAQLRLGKCYIRLGEVNKGKEVLAKVARLRASHPQLGSQYQALYRELQNLIKKS